jgi:hypothetical protein
MKYFLTGATGFVCGILAKMLRDLNHEVKEYPWKLKTTGLGIKLQSIF